MNPTKELISVMTKSEKRNFIHYLRERNKRNDVKNVDLFIALSENSEKQLKTSLGNNAYTVLKKRLNDRLLDFLGSSALDKEVSKESGIIKELLLSRKLFAFGYYTIGYKVLSKAEKEAKSINHYSLLNEIYHTLVENASKVENIDPVELHQKLEANTMLFLEEERLNLLYASIFKAYEQSERSGEKINLEVLLKEYFKKYNIPALEGLSIKSLFKIATIADVQGFHYRNYHDVDLYFVKEIKELENGPHDTEKNLYFFIGLLYTVANILFRKKEFEESLYYLDLMHKHMGRYDNKYYSVYYSRYLILTSLNANYLGQSKKAADLLEPILSSKKIDPAAHLCRIMIHFQQGEYDKAHKIMANLVHSDSWYEKNIGLEWTLNKNFIEILLHIELGSVDLTDSRIDSFLRRYSDHFKRTGQNQIIEFLKLIRKISMQPGIVDDDKFKNRVVTTLEFKPKGEEDIFLMSYYAWLKAKMEKKDLYQTTLELIADA